MKLAIIGSYGHVDVVLSGLEHAPDVELAGVARWGGPDGLGFVGIGPAANVPVFDDFRKMLEEVRPDVAAVFTPFAMLAETATAAAEAGCHVFMEKPVALTRADLAALRAAVDRAGVRLAACLAMRGEAPFLTIRRAVADGRIGTVLHAAAQKSYPFNRRDAFYRTRESYGGTIPWIGIHALDFIHFCTGQDYRRVAAMADNLAHPSHPGMEDQGALIAELSGGGTAVVRFDYLRPWGRAERPWGDDRLRLAGTGGIIETRDGAVTLTTPDAAESLPLEKPVNVFADFAAALAGGAEPMIGTDESFRMTEVALAARDAQDSGKVIEV